MAPDTAAPSHPRKVCVCRRVIGPYCKGCFYYNDPISQAQHRGEICGARNQTSYCPKPPPCNGDHGSADIAEARASGTVADV